MRKDQRRNFLLASGALLAAPLASIAQPAQKARRIGFLSQYNSPPEGPRSASQFLVNAFRRAGYEVGRDVLIEARYAEGRVERLSALAQELVRLDVELIVSLGNNATDEVTRATKTIPIVMFSSMFPVERGFAASLAHPGGNVTGTLWWAKPSDTAAKMYQVLKEAVPKAKRSAVIYDPTEPVAYFFDHEEEDRRAASIGLTNTRIEMTRPEGLNAVLDKIKASRAEVFWVTGGAAIISRHREIAAFAIEKKLVSLSDTEAYLRVGGLLSYGPELADLVDRTVSYVDRILRGAKPGDLPIEDARKYALALNPKTARAIGFNPPRSFMLRVDRQVE